MMWVLIDLNCPVTLKKWSIDEQPFNFVATFSRINRADGRKKVTVTVTGTQSASFWKVFWLHWSWILAMRLCWVHWVRPMAYHLHVWTTVWSALSGCVVSRIDFALNTFVVNVEHWQCKRRLVYWCIIDSAVRYKYVRQVEIESLKSTGLMSFVAIPSRPSVDLLVVYRISSCMFAWCTPTSVGYKRCYKKSLNWDSFTSNLDPNPVWVKIQLCGLHRPAIVPRR
jgi:hypothetical protein